MLSAAVVCYYFTAATATIFCHAHETVSLSVIIRPYQSA